MRQETTTARPYRSHAQPACLACRKRRSRCQTDAGSEVCLTCQIHGTECKFPLTFISQNPHRRKPSKAPRSSKSVHDKVSEASIVDQTEGSSDFRGVILDAQQEQRQQVQQARKNIESSSTRRKRTQRGHQSRAAGPADDQVPSEYISFMPSALRHTGPQHSKDSGTRPVHFSRLQRGPRPIALAQYPPQEKLTLIEKILEPHTLELINLYFEEVHPCFPLLDETSFRFLLDNSKEEISPSLLANLYAHTITYWDRSKSLARHARPDQNFIWRLANETIYLEMLLSPEISIIHAILLNISSNPATLLVGNSVLLASAVAIARSLGLNYSPMHWDISQVEKSLRMKIWWGIIICDRWTSLAYGTPPLIHKWEYDVPQLRFHDTCADAVNAPKMRQSCVFIALAELSNLLYNILQHIYDVNSTMTRDPVGLERAVSDWVDSLDGPTRLSAIEGANIFIPGAANLRLMYLIVCLLQDCMRAESDKQVENTSDGQFSALSSPSSHTCEEILTFTRNLDHLALNGFWLPTSGFAYSLVVGFLVRSAFDANPSTNLVAQHPLFRIASDLLSALRDHKKEYGWGLGDACLDKYSDVVARIEADAVLFEESSMDDDDSQHVSFMPDVSVVERFLAGNSRMDIEL